jgi:NAD(P)-dependent dehydrogenase (short-subunit alcohol dehydrogenase family)
MSEAGTMKDRRVLIIGASSGLGAAFAKAAACEGADVTISARRTDRLAALVEEMGTGTAVSGDATVPADAKRVAQTASDAMGGIDLMFYVAGYGVLQRIDDIDPDVWADVYRVNVLGANLAAAASLEHMGKDGICAFMSSRTVGDANAMFGSYSASKAALDQCIRTWRVERPDRRFIRVVMGNSQPTEFANHMGLELLGEALEAWKQQAIPSAMTETDDVGKMLAQSLGVALAHPNIDSSELKLDAREA